MKTMIGVAKIRTVNTRIEAISNHGKIIIGHATHVFSVNCEKCVTVPVIRGMRIMGILVCVKCTYRNVYKVHY